MKLKTSNWILWVASLSLIIPLEGKKYFPEILGSSYIQWGSAFLTALLIPIGMFLSIVTLVTCSDQKRAFGCNCLGFVILFSLIIGGFSVVTPIMIRVDNSLDIIGSRDALPKLLSKLQTIEDAEKRQVIAGGIYVLFGVAVPYKTEDGSYTVYHPTARDEERWAKSKENEVVFKETKGLLNSQLKQLPYLSSLYISSFFLTFLLAF